MRLKVILDFDTDMEEESLDEFLDAAKQCLEGGPEFLHSTVKVSSIEEIEICKLKQYSDQMKCETHGTVWDINDIDPPKCELECIRLK